MTVRFLIHMKVTWCSLPGALEVHVLLRTTNTIAVIMMILVTC